MSRDHWRKLYRVARIAYGDGYPSAAWHAVSALHFGPAALAVVAMREAFP